MEVAVGLVLHFSADDYRMVLQVARHLQVERDVGERCLESDARWHVDVEHKLLQALLNTFVIKIIVTDEWCQIGVETRECLCAGGFALHCVEEVDNLSQSRAQVLCRAALNLARNTREASHKKVFQIPTNAVNAQESQIVNMDVSRLVSLFNLFRINTFQPVLRTDDGCNMLIQTLQRVRRVGALFYPPVIQVDILVDNIHIRQQLLGVAHTLVLLAIDDVSLCSVE